MKFLTVFLFTFYLSSFLFSQDDGEGTYLDNECTIQIQNAVNRIITFELIPIGANWAKTTGCDISLYNDNTTYVSSLDGGSSGYIECWNNGFEYRFFNEGNYSLVEGCARVQSNAGLKPLRNGFYRINIKEDGELKIFAYFDWRDLGFPTNCNNCPAGNDITIRFDANLEKIKFYNRPNVQLNTQYDLILNQGDIITWADWKCNERVFTPFWSNGLVLAPDESNHPRIVWGSISRKWNNCSII